jgi:DNA-binding transcriptional MerR regulator
MKPLPIGALSRETGVKVPTIRYYEGIGLLAAPPRTESNRRTYGPEDVKRLRFIRHARDLGFEVDAIRQLLALAAHPEKPCAHADDLARAHLQGIDDKIARLVALRAEVQAMVETCEQGTVRNCRVMEVLADKGVSAPELAAPCP